MSVDFARFELFCGWDRSGGARAQSTYPFVCDGDRLINDGLLWCRGGGVGVVGGILIVNCCGDAVSFPFLVMELCAFDGFVVSEF